MLAAAEAVSFVPWDSVEVGFTVALAVNDALVLGGSDVFRALRRSWRVCRVAASFFGSGPRSARVALRQMGLAIFISDSSCVRLPEDVPSRRSVVLSVRWINMGCGRSVIVGGCTCGGKRFPWLFEWDDGREVTMLAARRSVGWRGWVVEANGERQISEEIKVHPAHSEIACES